MSDAPKQVIVMRKDLNMRKGKMVAQGCHASLGAVLMIKQYMDAAERTGAPFPALDKWEAALSAWLAGKFTKICVSVNSQLELHHIHGLAEAKMLPVKMIVDSGQTEFNGVPTETCLAIGPYWPADIDEITGKLPLL